MWDLHSHRLRRLVLLFELGDDEGWEYEAVGGDGVVELGDWGDRG